MSRLSEVIGDGGGSVVSDSEVLLGWTPTDEDADAGGPDTVNPLLNDDGSCAIDPEWIEPRSVGVASIPAVIRTQSSASGGVNALHTRGVHDRAWRRDAQGQGRVRRVRLSWQAASGGDVELVRRFVQVTRSGAGTSRFRHPLLDPDGPASSAPMVRPVPGTWTIRRSPGGERAEMGIEIEYVD